MNKKRLIAIIFVSIICLLLIGWFWWVNDYYKATNDAISQIQGSESLSILTNDKQIMFYPSDGKAKTGFIIYPGGKVDFRSYVPTAKAIAQKGYKVVVVKMPQNLAIFGVNKAQSIIAESTEIQKWVIGGHSLGGAMASDYAINHTDKISGIVFWASYPSKDLSASNLKTLVMYGSNDAFVGNDKIDSKRKLLPSNPSVVIIEGGNHSNFGYYGLQKGDNESKITKEQQQQIIIDQTVDFLKKL